MNQATNRQLPGGVRAKFGVFFLVEWNPWWRANPETFPFIFISLEVEGPPLFEDHINLIFQDDQKGRIPPHI